MDKKMWSIIIVSAILAVCEGGNNGYGQYPSHSGGYPGGYPGGYNPGVAGPPGAHPGCPLCDSSVYSYCSYKQSHDACCCNNGGGLFSFNNCRRQDCSFIYANTCEEYNLISGCCCIDVNLRSVAPVQVAAPAITG